MCWVGAVSIAVIAGCLTPSRAAETLIFDSYTPPPFSGGFSSANGGQASELSVSQNQSISRIAIRNEMLSAGQLKFVILSYPQPQFLYVSAPSNFAKDITGEVTWKMSPSLDFTLQGSKQYLIGYVRSVACNDYMEHNTVESSSGITSALNIHTLNGFTSPSYSHLTFHGNDGAVRLYALPEPANLSVFVLCGLLARRRRAA